MPPATATTVPMRRLWATRAYRHGRAPAVAASAAASAVMAEVLVVIIAFFTPLGTVVIGAGMATKPVPSTSAAPPTFATRWHFWTLSKLSNE